MRKIVALTVFAAGGMLAAPAWAVIEALLPLQKLIGDSDQIVMVKVDRVDPAKPAMVLTVGESLKGKTSLTRIPLNLTGDKDAEKGNHTAQLLKRVAPEVPLVAFIKEEAKGKFMMLACTNGTWFQALGQADGEQVRWQYTHCEVYLRRTYKGTTADLQQIVTGVVSGKRRPPPPNPKEPAGFGPELP